MPLRTITLVVSFLIGISLSLAPDKANVESRPSHRPPPRLLLQPLNNTAVANTSSVPTMVSVLGGDGDIVDISIGKVEWISHRFRCQDTHPNHAASHPCVLAKKKLAIILHPCQIFRPLLTPLPIPCRKPGVASFQLLSSLPSGWHTIVAEWFPPGQDDDQPPIHTQSTSILLRQLPQDSDAPMLVITHPLSGAVFLEQPEIDSADRDAVQVHV